jgi:hypothetical protein
LGFLAGLGRPVFYNERYDFDSNGSISAVDFLILKNVLSDPAVNKIYIFKAARLIDQDRNAIVTPAEINTALKAVKAHLLTKPGMPGWDEQYDIDNSGAVMAPDLQIVKNFGTNEYGDIIAIELEGLNPWTLNSVVLGTKTGNLGENSQPMHKIKNIGNTPVAIEVGYGPGIPEGIHPGLQQGLDTFITLAAGVIIPPSEKINLGKVIQPGEAEPLPLIYGAPTGLSGQTREMSLNLEIRVYAAVNQE